MPVDKGPIKWAETSVDSLPDFKDKTPPPNKTVPVVENTVLEYVNSIYPTNLMPDWATDAEQVKIKEILDGFERFKKWAVSIAESK